MPANKIIYLNKSERREVVKPIINKLTELELTVAYEPVKELFKILKLYIDEGNRYNINIPFPMINKRIKGLLSDVSSEKVWIKLEHEAF